MSIEVATLCMPAHWASYLVNGDASSFDYCNTPACAAGDRDLAQCNAWLDDLALEGWRVVSTVDDSEAYFAEIQINGRRFVGNVLTYILHRTVQQ